MKKIVLSQDKIEPEKLEEIKKIFFKGGIVALPTETVYGLGVLASCKEAVERLYEVKRRDRNKPFSLCVANKKEALDLFSLLPPYGFRLAERFWPGPLTIVFYEKKGEKKIGVRVPAHKTLVEILKELKEPICLPSANISGEKEAVTSWQVEEIFSEDIDLLVEAEPPQYNKASTVVDLTFHPFKILREGVIPQKEIIETFIRKRILFVCTGNTCRSPLAQFLLKKYLSQIVPFFEKRYEILSCGIIASEGASLSEEIKKILKEYENLEAEHFARKIDKEILLSSDLIFVMEKKHKEFITNLEPLLESRVFLLGKFLPQEQEIPDPIGKPFEFHLEVYNLIKEAILELREWL